MKIGELTKRLNVRYRDVRYVLEEGLLPTGVEESPGRGEHRDLDPAQTFWLAIVLKLKMIGIRTPVAAEIANFARRAVQGITQNANWEFPFHPFRGRLQTTSQWYLEVGDLQYIRLVTDTNPSVQGLYEFPWSVLGKHETVEAKPLVIIRMDIAGLARILV